MFSAQDVHILYILPPKCVILQCDIALQDAYDCNDFQDRLWVEFFMQFAKAFDTLSKMDHFATVTSNFKISIFSSYFLKW